MITARLAEPADAEVLARLRWDFRMELHPPDAPEPHSWAEFRTAMLEFLSGPFASRNWAIWLAEEEGQIVAQIFIRRIRKVPNPQELHAEIGYVTNVYCRPAWRNRGVGSQLMQAAQEWARQTGLELLFLWPSERSVPFYLRHGFCAENEMLELLLTEE